MDNSNPSILWKAVLAELEVTVSPTTYKSHLSSLQLVEFNQNIATIACIHSFHRDQVETKYYTLLKQTLDKHTRANTSLVFTIQTPSRHTKPVDDLPLFSSSSNSNQITQLPNYPITKSPSSRAHLGINFTFDTFAVGSTNQLAFAAAEAVARQPGSAYNPLFIWGGTGVGKSHLMQAIGHAILHREPDTKIIFCPGEDFTNEIIAAIRTKTTMKFKEKYRKIDVLLLDDIQFLAGKDTAQEEFFHTFNAITRDNGQIVMTGDRPPSELTKLEDRLRSRFQAGLIVDIGEPDFELRTAILLIKSKQRGFELPMDLAQSIAESITSARELEGFLMRLQAKVSQQNLKNHDAPHGASLPDIVADLLGKPAEPALRRGLRPTEVLKATADHFDIKITQLKSPSRLARLVLPRQLVMYLLYKDLNIPYQTIGSVINRDHTTVMHGVEKIEDNLGISPELRGHLSGIREALKA